MEWGNWRITQILVWVLLAGIGSEPASAGAWGKAPGELELISSVEWVQASREYNDKSTNSSVIALGKLESSLYAEYGIRDGWTAVGRVAIQDVSLQRGASVDKASGFAASYMGVRRQLLAHGEWVGAIQAGAFIPGATENGLDLRLGHGGVEAEARLLLGRNFALVGHKGFMDAQLARRIRSEGMPDEWHAAATVGLNIGKRQMWLVQGFHAQSDRPSSPRFRELRQTKLRGSLVWQLSERRRMQIFGETAIDGLNTVADYGFGIGFWLQFP